MKRSSIMSDFFHLRQVNSLFGAASSNTKVGKPSLMPTPVSKSIYRIIYFNNEDMFEIYATQIYQSEIYGFIEVEELLFGNRSSLVVDPGEEKLKNEFDGVKRSFIPVSMVVRIDEVEKSGVPKIKGVKGSSVTALSPAPRNGS